MANFHHRIPEAWFATCSHSDDAAQRRQAIRSSTDKSVPETALTPIFILAE